MKTYLLIVSISLLSVISVFAQNKETEKQYDYACIAFYNFENLFDTLVDLDTNKILQDEFTPLGAKKWNTPKYYEKLDNMALVVSKLGVEQIDEGAAIIGVSEIENRSVLEDFVKENKIKARNYQIVHYESPDRRGIDVGLLYNPSFFEVESSKPFTVVLEGDSTYRTRDQLLVTGKLNGERIHIVVAHWPSRRGGQKVSTPKRMAAAVLGRSIIDSITKAEPSAKIFYMGDLNDDPINPSVRKGLHSVGKIDKMEEGSLFNPMESYYKKGIGTLGYRDTWNLFDQIIITSALLKTDSSSYRYQKAVIYNKDYLKQKSGKYIGYPKRTYSFGQYNGGYSDHFPVYLFLVKEK